MSITIGAYTLKNNPEFGQSGTNGIIKEHNWMPDGGGMQKLAASLITADANEVIAVSLPMLDDELAYVDVWIMGRGDGDAKRCTYHLEGLFFRSGSGNLTQEGATTVVSSIETDAGLAGVLGVNTSPQQVEVKVTGIAATNIRWKVFMKAMKVQQPA